MRNYVARRGTVIEIESAEETTSGFQTKLKNFRRKKMKNTITAATLAIVLTFGATLANAEGIIIGSRSEGIIIGSRAENAKCTPKETYGILVSDRPILSGVLTALAGIIIGSRSTGETCKERNGILVSDRNGILVSD